jgi:ubiquinone/menaquinone biosynthesis C-methylase UbiE
MSTPETWDKVYANFDNFNPIDQAFYDRLTSILITETKDLSSILEVGSGSGILVSFFEKSGLLSVGMDRSVMPLNVAKSKFEASNLVSGDMFQIPFKSNSFDIVWNEGVLEHFKYPKNLAACKEMTRVSKNLVIIAVPNRYTVWPVRKILLKATKKWPYGYEESYSSNRLKRLMENAGLTVEAIKGVRIMPPIKERKKFSDFLALGTLTLPLSKKSVENISKKSVFFESKHELLTKLFGYEIIAIGRKNKN